MRSVDEWVGATDDADIPKRVKLRVWERCGGRCALTGRKLRPGDKYEFDHIKALENGGRHIESNLQVVTVAAHKEKTADDARVKNKTDRMSAKHKGLWPKSPTPMRSRGFPKRGGALASTAGGSGE